MINSEKIKLGLVEHLIWLIILGVFIVFSLTISNFFTFRNILFILYVASPLGFLVFGVTLGLLSGNTDLSLAENAGLTAILVGVILVDWAPWLPGWVGIILMVLISALLGTVNGFFVGKMKINSFLFTLCTFLIFNWSTFYIRRGTINKVPNALLVLGGGKTGGIFNSIFVFAGMVFIIYILLEHTRFGSHIKAIGGNSETSRMLGIHVENTNFLIFTISGALAGISSLLYVGYLKCIPSTIADGAIFLAFTGAIMGGVSSGRGSIMGAVGGIILMGIIDAGCTMTAIDPALRQVVNGFILLIAILINRTRENLRDRILMPK